LGEVFVALDEELNREVALKEIQSRYAHDDASRARFLREGEITGRLEHPGIVPVYGLGRHANGRPYYAMRLIKGEPLGQAIDRFHAGQSAQADPGERARGLRQLLGRFLAVCNAIAYAHSRGVIHRDLKPDNVMLGEYGETLVVDWGLARTSADQEAPASGTLRLAEAAQDSGLTRAGEVLGTPAYMSPEQAAGGAGVGPASDVYSLGATLYHLLTGGPPFETRSQPIETLLEQVCAGEFPPPREVNPTVPAALEAVCLKATALCPQDRYASAKDLAEAVERWLADEPFLGYADAIFSLSPDGKYTSLTPAFEALYGWSREEWLGKPFAPMIHPEDLPMCLSLLQEARRGKTENAAGLSDPCPSWGGRLHEGGSHLHSANC